MNVYCLIQFTFEVDSFETFVFLTSQARKGRTWSFDIEEEITDLATEFTDDLMKDGLTKKILTLLEKLDVVKELDKLSKERALGDSKHRHDVSF